MAPRLGHGSQHPLEDEYRTVLAHKDAEVAELKEQLCARKARGALLEARLLAALDTLDVTQANHAEEIENERKQNTKLRKKLAVLQKAVRDMETEKADLQDAVLKLIQRVEEENNEFSQWPRSRLRDSDSSLSHSESKATRPSSSPSPEAEQHQHFYFAGVIKALMRDLAHERTLRTQLKKEADARIALLEAQLVRRELELENSITGENMDVPQVSKTSLIAEAGSQSSTLPPLSDEERLRILDETSRRNRTLEGQIKALAKNLEQAKRLVLENAGTSKPEKQSKPIEIETSSTHSDAAVQTDHQSYDLPDLQYAGKVLDTLQGLGYQIDSLGKQVNGLSQERMAMFQAIAPRSSWQPLGIKEEQSYDFPRILAIEAECIRLRQSEAALRAELVNKQQQLNEEIAELKRTLEDFRHSPSPNPNFLKPNDIFSSDNDPPTLSVMTEEEDLTTSTFPPMTPDHVPIPLQSPMTSSMNSTPARIIDIDGSPLFSSFYSTPSRIGIDVHGHSPGTPSLRSNSSVRTHSRVPSEDLARIERELQEARRDAEDKSRAISELKAVIEELHRIHTENGGPGSDD